MKIQNLRKKIILNFIALGTMSLILAAGIGYNFYARSTLEAKVNKIKGETSQIRNQTVELQSKTMEVKKYTELWKSLSENKKNTNGIKMDEVNAHLATLAEKYTILTPTIKVTLPETLKDGIFNRTTVNVLFTTANLSFTAVNDVKALAFITEFVDSLPGYTVVTNLELKRGKTYTDQDLIAISSGKGMGNVAAKVDFFWYAYKNKEDTKPEDGKKSGDNPAPAPTPPAGGANAQ